MDDNSNENQDNANVTTENLQVEDKNTDKPLDSNNESNIDSKDADDETKQDKNTSKIEDEQNKTIASNTKEDENKTKENEKNDDTKFERKLSNYFQNIQISHSSPGLVLSEKDAKQLDKEATLLADSKTVVRFSPVWKQTLAASASILLTFTAGLTSGYSAILLPQLEAGLGNAIPSDADTGSWIASMAALPMAPGCLLSGWMMEKFGRKTSHYMVCAPFLLGWILIACSTDLTLMLLGRFFTGLCVGLLGPLGPVYIGETTDPKYRGFFLAAVSLAIAVGIFVAHLIGTFMTWKWTATICCVFPIISAVMLTLVPESPTWLISKGQTEDGTKAFQWLRGYDETAKIELKGLIDKQKAVDSEPIMTWKEKVIYLTSPELLKPLFIMIIFFVTCQFSGVNAVAFYSVQIVEKTVGKGINHYLAMLLIDSLRVFMSVVACVVCKQYGRRPLCFISGIWTALSLVGLSMFLYWSHGKETHMAWLPLTCLMVYITAVSIGLVPLPWIMCGEVFPTRVRGLGSGISSATTFASFFIVVKTAPGMMTNLGEVVTFLIYGIIALIGTIIMYFILPETKGKSLQEIEERFRNGKKVDPTV